MALLEAIFCCGCNNQDKKAEYAFRIAFPDSQVPTIHKGKDTCRRVAEQHPDTNLARQLQAFAKLSGQWAYYLTADDQGNITTLYDLVKNRRIQ